jgi:hypothetical protein
VSVGADGGSREAPPDRGAAPAAQPDAVRRRLRVRLHLMALGMLALLSALAGGLARLGWPLPVAAPLVAFHGPLMVAGFLGTVIGLERAVALGRSWAYGGPIASGLGALAVATGVPGGAELMLLGSMVMVAAFVAILGRQVALFTVVMALGALFWVIGQALWLAGRPVHRVVWWWAGFLVLTIVGERLDLSRLQRPTASSHLTFVTAAGLLLVGLWRASLAPDDDTRLVGAGFVALAVWLGAFDVARRTVRGAGLTRFIAAALLSGYAWLAAAGLLLLRWPHVAAGAQYDAIVHALFVGFVFSMIFGHAPIIFPAVLGVRVAYRPIFYLPLALLHASLVLRMVGDLASWLAGRQWGGLLNALAIVLFFALVVHGVVGRRPPV